MSSHYPNSALRHLQAENERLKQELDYARTRAEVCRVFLHSVSDLQAGRSNVSTEAELLAFLGHALECARAAVQADEGSLLMVDSDSHELVFMQVRGTHSATLPGYRIQPGEGIAGWVVANGSAQIVNAPYRDPRFSPRVDNYFQFVTHNLVAVPIRGKAGTLGVLEVVNKAQQHDFVPNDLDMLNIVADLTAGAITRVELAVAHK